MILIVAPHGDDESLGCGGIITKFKATKQEVHWLIGTKENKPYNRVADFLGIKKIHKLDLVDGKIDTYEFGDIVAKISRVIKTIQPKIVFMPYRYDVHSDHRIIAEATLAASKSFRAPYIESILMYEVPSETEWASVPFQPNVFQDITPFIEQKIDAVNEYRLEQHLSGGKIRAVSMMRGAMVDREYAEAYQLVRQIYD